MFIDLHKLIMHKAFLALLVSTGCAMMGDVPRMRFPQKRSNDISKVRETTNAEGFSCCFNEDCAARTVCSLTRAAHISATGALLPKKQKRYPTQQPWPRTLHGHSIVSVMSNHGNQVILSDSNRTPIVQIVVWFCLVTSFLAVVTHAGIKLFVFRAVKAESVLLLVSLVSSKTYWARCNAVDCTPRYFASHSQRLC
jgi:hypothetical protein